MAEFKAWSDSIALTPEQIDSIAVELLRPTPAQVFTIAVPLPPTLNEFLGKAPMLYNQEKRRWMSIINGILRRNDCPIFDGFVYCHIRFMLKNKTRDQDNAKACEKFFWDSMGKPPRSHQGEWTQFAKDDRLEFVGFPTYTWYQGLEDLMVVSLSSSPIARTVLCDAIGVPKC